MTVQSPYTVPVCLEDPGNLGNQGIVRVGVAQEGADRQEDLRAGVQGLEGRAGGVWGLEGRRSTEAGGKVRVYLADGEGGGPLGSEDVQADGAVRVDVGVVDPGGEGHLGGREVITSNTAKTRLN